MRHQPREPGSGIRRGGSWQANTSLDCPSYRYASCRTPLAVAGKSGDPGEDHAGRSSSIRSSWLYFDSRSELCTQPILICPASVPTAKSAMSAPGSACALARDPVWADGCCEQETVNDDRVCSSKGQEPGVAMERRRPGSMTQSSRPHVSSPISFEICPS